MKQPWYQIKDPSKVASPALLVFPERVRKNINEMVRIAGSADRLRPHVKTHKCREIVALQQAAGVTKFKCATIAEAEMLAQCSVSDILLAYQPTGPSVSRFLQLVRDYPAIEFSALVDNPETVKHLDELSGQVEVTPGVYIDLDVGMHRTGIAPGPEVSELVRQIGQSSSLNLRGWHVYDGHIRTQDFDDRKKLVESCFNTALPYIMDNQTLEVVAGGSPSFTVHALTPRVNLSPGTCLLWDQGYNQILTEQGFEPAAILLTRVISKPGNNLLCLDLGHKALASEMAHPRVYLPELGQVEFLSHSEEHLVLRTDKAADFKVGEVLYGIPMHICPTVALHQELVIIENREEVDRWEVYARNRRISI